ncbi:MAG TPA: CHAT domain-containing tetratricopeptide repeat protein [Gemmatimonadales bacterium]|nr:CHAT domain-containing tetratricopeptide repeat protein [Gemmatimonadales bacterium]
MLVASPLWLLAAMAVQAPAMSSAESLVVLARDAPDSVLVVRAQERPDDIRDALRRLFALAAPPSHDTLQAVSLAAATRLAGAYAVTWRDSFLLRQVARYRSLPPAERRAKVAADSLRRTGNEALGRKGVAAAMRLWRESLRSSLASSDTAGAAAVLGNLGRGFYDEGSLDSAEVEFDRSRDWAERIGDWRTMGNAIGNLASVSKDRGDLARARKLYARAGELRERTGDARGAAADRNNLGLIAEKLGDLAGARHAFSEALVVNRRDGRLEPAALNLVNLGSVASLEGDYADADARYAEALTIYRGRGNRVETASVLHDLGRLALRRGDYAAALGNLGEALRIYHETGPLVAEVAVRRDLVDARAAVGNLQGALSELGRAERLAAARGERLALQAELALTRADLDVEFNNLAEADRQYGRAERLARRAGDGAVLAEAQHGRAYLRLAREDYAGAQALLTLALRTQRTLGDTRSAAVTRILLGTAQRQEGDTAGARRSLITAIDSLQAVHDPIGEAAALGALGDLEAASGTTLTAESLYQRGLARIGDRLAPDVAWQLHAGWGEALRSRGALDQAATELRAAVAETERVSGRLSLEEYRSTYLADKWDVYAQLAVVERARGHPDSAFAASERLRARQLLDLLARGRVAWSRTGDDSLAEREQDLRRRITELTRRLESPEGVSPGLRGPPLSAPASGAVREALASAQGAYADLLLTMRTAKPEYASLVSGALASWRDVSSRLAPDEALLEYVVSDSTTLVFVVTADTITALDLGIDRRALNGLIDFARGVLAHPAPPGAPVPWEAPLERLYRTLIEPIEATGLLKRAQTLLIAPHGELHYLPFAALRLPGPPRRFLVERYRLASVPSASVWLRLRERPARSGDGSVLALAPRADALPGSRVEVATIGRIYGDRAHVLVGPEASRLAFVASAPRASILHLATFGVLNKDNPLFSFVELAPHGADDGRLEVHDVFGLLLNARLVVLSACQTGLGSGTLADVPAGDDWVGLVRAFLFAGASNVVATLWPVEDRAMAGLMERFYADLAAGRSEVDALADAQRAVLRNPSTGDPFYWGGVTLNGGL